ncbi:MAG: PRC-barrel domain-containing protein [Clostridia bacterium]|nr:PRC-barrel domain-containing protein [Clostridia bacterium]
MLDAVFDESLKIYEGCIVADDETENTFFLKRKDILSSGDDCVVIESSRVLEYDVSSSTNNPIGKEVYNERGVFLGMVTDVCVVGKCVKKIITKRCEIPQKFIKKSGNNYLIFGIFKNNQKKANKLIFKENETLEKINDLLPKIVISEVAAGEKQKNKTEDVVPVQTRFFANPNSLLGRSLTRDLFGMNNEIIARKNDKIDKKIIKNAKNHNKLSILAYFSQ